jgi:transcriptional regulator with XRE-family HTH domain|tara:strand:- start:1046 stop:1264 length:219 start_codon:yes stop_codon:yes gene_type:complete
MSINERFGATVKSIRKSLNISQEELASLAGMDRAHMGRIERGTINAGLTTIARIAKALHCAPAQLLDYTKSD